jgi:hypothetical protein
MDNHIGPLKSCCILHMFEMLCKWGCCAVDEDVTEKRVIKVSLEREPFDYLEEMISTTLTDAASTLDLPFEVFSNFEVLELKSYHFKTTPNSNPQQV